MRLSLLIRDLGYAGAQRQLVALAKGMSGPACVVTVFCFYGGPLQKELESAGVNVVCLGKKNRWDMLGFLFRLVRCIRATRPDVLYSFLNEANLMAALMKPLLPGTRIVWGLRDSETDAALYGWLGRLVFTLGKVFSKWPDLLIANSHSGARYYAEQGYPKDRLVVVPNGIDIDRFQPDPEARSRLRGELGIADDETLFGIVGRLSPMKDYATFLRAAAQVQGRVRFLAIGGGTGEYGDQMRALAGELELSSRLLWSAPRNDMPAVFNALDALVSSSAYGEGFSNVAGEAMACGTPCIVTDVGDSAKLVAETGFSVPARNPDALAAAMQQFLHCKPGVSARDRIVEHFTVPQMIERTEALLHPISRCQQPVTQLLFTITALGSGGAEMMLTQLITNLDRTRFEPQVISLVDGGKHADILRATGVPVHSLGMPAGKPTLRSLFRLRSLTKQIKPDLIIGWMYHGNLAATLAAWIGHHAPVLWNVRQSLYSLAYEKRSSALVIKLLAYLDHNPQQILYNSQISARQHEAIGYDSAKTMLVPNGFNTESFKPDPSARASVRQELGLPPDAVLIGRFGRNSAMKDYPTFIAAMEQLPSAYAIIAGTGTEELSTRPNVIILGERHDLSRLTAALDIACSSSAFGEGFPNVVAEAMSCGVPCVVTDVGDSAWLLKDAGRIVPPSHADALAKALAEVIALSPDDRRTLGEQGRQRILNDFSLPAVVRQFEQILVSSFSPSPLSLPCVA